MIAPTPPGLAVKLFEWFCGHAAVEDLRGDMDELFYLNLERMSPFKAKWIYWKQSLSLIFSYAVRKRKTKSPYASTPLSVRFDILANYFTVARRNLARQKFFTVINVLGMSFGMCIGLLLIALLSFVSTYDNFHANRDRIYRVTSVADESVRVYNYACAPPQLGDKLQHEFTGIEKVVRINNAFSAEAIYEGKELPLSGYFTEPEFFNMFSFPLIKGNPGTALSKPHTLVITEKAGIKMFGDQDPVGRVISMGEFGDFEITGVLKDIPKNSHMKFEVLASYETWIGLNANKPALPRDQDGWHAFRNNYTYILLDENRVDDVNAFLHDVAGQTYTKEEKYNATFQLQALNDIVPGPELSNQIGPDWEYNGLLIFTIMTLLILLPACFNYTNISISRALKRAKEIGLRKVVGGQRNQIFLQFITETVIVTLLALLGSYVIFFFIRDAFTEMLVHSDGLDLTPTFTMGLYFIGFAVLVGFMAGVVPALHFSKLNPVEAIRNTAMLKTMKGLNIRKVLIVSQFALSLGFIMSVVIAYTQYRASMNHDFGFTRENILDVDLQGVDPEIFRNEFSQLSSVRSLSMSSNVMGTSTSGTVSIKAEGSQDSIEVVQMFVDQPYVSNMELKVLAGTGFAENGRENTRAVIVNEAFLKSFNIATPLDAVGRVYHVDSVQVRVAGVVGDFHYTALREPIRAFFFRYDPTAFQYANLKIVSGDIYGTMTDMEAVWKKIGGERKFEARFFDDEISDTYSSYFSMIRIFGFMGLMAIIISCLGLLGMVVYTIETRTKELGVRKVMGASTVGLTMLLSRGYLIMMLVAAIIAVPITYVIFDKVLLQLQFYRSSIGVVEIVVSLLIMLVLGGITVLSQTIRASKKNPVDTLRYE